MGKLHTFLIVIILTFLTGCGDKKLTKGPLPPTWAVEDDFIGYVEDFLSEGASRGINPSRNLVVVMRDNFSYSGFPNAVGICAYPNKERAYPLIEIKRSYWESADDESRRQLMFHELGHCLLLRDHTSESAYVPTLNRNVPLSVMNPYVLRSYGFQVFSFYLSNFSTYMDELFNPLNIASLRTIANNSARTPEDNLNIIASTDTEPLDIGGQVEFTADGKCNHTHIDNPGGE